MDSSVSFKKKKIDNRLERIFLRKYPGIIFLLDETGKYLELIKLVIPEKQRNQGLGTKIMIGLCEEADRYKKILTLTPTNIYGSDFKRLIKFYKKFGFVMNEGKNQINIIDSEMYRKIKL